MALDTPSLPSSKGGGRLYENIMHFARVLRAAGLPVGPGRVVDAVKAVRMVGIGNRDDFYWTLHAVFVNRHDHRELFDQAFHIFWRNPRILERMMHMVLPEFKAPNQEKGEDLSRRLADAISGNKQDENTVDQDGSEEEYQFDAALTYSDKDVLRTMDFEKMSLVEVKHAKAAIRTMRLPIRPVTTRRFQASKNGRRADMRASLRAAARPNGSIEMLRFKKPRRRQPPMVVICDISGSMARYSRMLLHFMHALTSDRDRVHTFLFGTHLSNVTRYLRYNDVDEAVAKVGKTVNDWSGGTRIGHCLHQFNQVWSRRVLTQGPLVLLITDGLDREVGADLQGEMDRLRRSCRRLIWLNPLLRYDGFEPKSQGIRAILPHVDEFRPIHSLESLEQLVDALSGPAPSVHSAMAPWLTQLQQTAPASVTIDEKK